MKREDKGQARENDHQEQSLALCRLDFHHHGLGVAVFFFVVPAFFFVAVPVAFAGALGTPTISICSMRTGVSARLLSLLQTLPWHGPCAILVASATVASSHWPKMV